MRRNWPGTIHQVAGSTPVGGTKAQFRAPPSFVLMLGRDLGATASACGVVGTSSTDVEILVLGTTASTLIQGHHPRHRVGGTA